MRLGNYADKATENLRVGFSDFATSELGIYVDPDMISTFQSASIRDVLDLVTLYFEFLSKKSLINSALGWRAWVARVFEEENLSYRIDNQGGVHFHPDEEYVRNSEATIEALRLPRYANVLDAFLRSRDALMASPIDGKGAIRAVFSSAEGLFRILIPNAHRLGAKESEQLRPLLSKLYAGNATALRSAEKLLNSFEEWVDAAHFYRHEEGRPDEVAQPPTGLAVYLTSAGASHIRWLAELDIT